MTVEYIADHAAQAQSRLVSQYQSAPNVVSLVSALASRTQVLEDAIRKVAKGRFLVDDSATGAQLDAVGSLVGIARNGVTDAVYRVLIRGKIATNTSRATLNDIEGIAKTLFQASAIYATTPNTWGHARAHAYAQLSLAVADPKTDASLYPLVLRLIRASLPAGVVLASVSVFSSTQAFACAGVQPWAQGFASLDGQGGGMLASLIDSNPLA